MKEAHRKITGGKNPKVYRQFFIDDAGHDKVHSVASKKTIVVSLQLASEGKKKRRIGVITRSTKTMVIKRSRALHLFYTGQAYGFNEYILKHAQMFDTIRLGDEYANWKIPVKFILENGRYLNFKQQGFEKQLFVSLDQLEQFKVHKEEGRRI